MDIERLEKLKKHAIEIQGNVSFGLVMVNDDINNLFNQIASLEETKSELSNDNDKISSILDKIEKFKEKDGTDEELYALEKELYELE